MGRRVERIYLKNAIAISVFDHSGCYFPLILTQLIRQVLQAVEMYLKGVPAKLFPQFP